MDYTKLFDRWVASTTLSEEDRVTLIEKLHEEIVSGVQALGGLAVSEMSKLLEEATYDKKDKYIEDITPVVALAALDGYMLFLITHDINPQEANLAKNENTKEVSKIWSTAYNKDQCISYLEKVDPIVGMMLSKISELRVNQELSFHPSVVELPYKTTEKLHQYIGWSVHQGYVLGAIEKELHRG